MVPLAALRSESGIIARRGMLEFGVLRETHEVGRAGDDGKIRVGGAQLFDPIQIMDYLARECLEHIIGRPGFLILPKLLEILERILLAIFRRVHEDTGGKRAVSIAEGALALLNEKACRIRVFLCHGNGCRHAGQARANDKDVGLFIPFEPIGGRVARAARATGGTLRAATHKSHAREPSNHKRCPRCLHERPSALICRHKISSPETAQSLHATICYHAQVRSCEKTEGSETPVFGQFWKSRISGCDQKQGKQRFEQGKLNAFSAE